MPTLFLSDSDEDMIGPPLPPSMKNSPAPEEELIGPPVPTGKKIQEDDSDDDGEDDDSELDEVLLTFVNSTMHNSIYKLSHT